MADTISTTARFRWYHPAERVSLGVRFTESPDEDGAKVGRVSSNTPAAKAGLKTGDVILRVDDTTLNAAMRLTDVLAAKSPGDTVTLDVQRDGQEIELKAELSADPAQRAPTLDNRASQRIRKDALRLAIIGNEYPDARPNEKIAVADWEESLFSTGTYANKNNATGQPVYGSMIGYDFD